MKRQREEDVLAPPVSRKQLKTENDEKPQGKLEVRLQTADEILQERYEEDEVEEQEVKYCWVHGWDSGHFTEVGECSEAYGVHKITALVSVDGKPAGRITMDLVDRDMTQGGFFEACDTISRELQSLSVLFFDNDGKPRRSEIKNHGDGSGGVLHICYNKISKAYRHRTGEAIKKLLTETDLTGHWQIAFYYPESYLSGQYSPEEWRSGQDDDIRQFYQAGFNQVKSLASTYGESDSMWVFTTEEIADKKPLLTAKEAAKMKIMRPPKVAKLSGPDELLENFVERYLEEDMKHHDVSRLIETVKDLLKHGANLENVDAMHYAAACGALNAMTALIALCPQSVNARSRKDGNTPLMIAAAAQAGKNTADTSIVKKLLELGADKNLTNNGGRTAYGLCVSHEQGMHDFITTFRLDRISGTKITPGIADVLKLVRPDNGATKEDLEETSHGFLADVIQTAI